MFEWFKKEKNNVEIINTNIELKQEEVRELANEIEKQTTKYDEIELITPELCRGLQHRRDREGKEKLIKIINRKIKLYANCGKSKTNIIFDKTEERLCTDFIMYEDYTSIHKNDLNEVLDIFKNKGFKVDIENGKNKITGKEKVIIEISWK